MKPYIFVAALLLAAPAIAQPTPGAPSQESTGRVLWQNVAAGMTRDQVRGLYPAQGDRVHHRDDVTIIEDYAVTDRCKATVRIFHEQGKVDRVEVRGEGSIGGRCSDTVLTALSARYGEALSRERGGDGIFRRAGTTYVWSRDGITLRFRKLGGGAFGGSGLGAPSWELTYSEIADNVAL
jgi:hypothetical protein